MATGINKGSCTGPCGSVRIEARAFVVCYYCEMGPYYQTRATILTEQRAISSKVNADDIEVIGAIAGKAL